MCPLSAVSQIFVLLFFLLVCCTALAQTLVLYLQPKDVTVKMYEIANLNYTIEGELDPGDSYCLAIQNDDPGIVSVNKKIYITTNNSSGSVDVFGNFLGSTNLSVEVKAKNCTTSISQEKNVKIKVIRKDRVIDKVFSISVAVLVSIIYINFGAALKIEDIKSQLKRPVGLLVGFAGQFICMPLLSYIIGYVLFPNNPALQLGIFYTGCAPSGGASNIWTALLDGNIDLSIALTTMGTFIAFATIPFWTFTLGALIFDKNNLEIPYRNISTYAIGLVIPLTIGYIIQRYSTRTANFLRRTLKGFSGFLIVFIIVFAIIANLYLFKLFSWRIIVSGMGLPWLGYLAGWLLSKVFNLPAKDCLTTAIEVGLQNTGIAIFLLRFSLPQPEADITTIAPVSVAIMTPIPLFILFLIKFVQKRINPVNDKLKYAVPPAVGSDTECDDNLNIKKNGVAAVA